MALGSRAQPLKQMDVPLELDDRPLLSDDKSKHPPIFKKYWS